jgi:DNA-binding winged helix-turn-helix (wHTH) protein
MANSSIPDEFRRLRFGPFSLDPRAGELYKRGKKVKVQLLPLQLLGALLEKPGEVINREELKSKLWPADTFVDFEHGLNTAIKKLRRALGDNPVKPGLIETLPKKGYRFIGRLEANGAKPPVNPPRTTALAGKIFSVFAEDGIECVLAPVDENSRNEWQRLIALGDDVGVSMMITNNRLLLIEVGKPVRVLSADGSQGWLEARITAKPRSCPVNPSVPLSNQGSCRLLPARRRREADAFECESKGPAFTTSTPPPNPIFPPHTVVYLFSAVVLFAASESFITSTCPFE